MAEKTRISVSVSGDLLDEFDTLSRSLGHVDRSKAVSEAMREFIAGKRWDLAGKGTASGVILLTYEHHARGINATLTGLQHEFPDEIAATMHIHLSKHTCLEVIAFRGSADRIRSLATRLHSRKGVLDLKVVTSPT